MTDSISMDADPWGSDDEYFVDHPDADDVQIGGDNLNNQPVEMDIEEGSNEFLDDDDIDVGIVTNEEPIALGGFHDGPNQATHLFYIRGHTFRHAGFYPLNDHRVRYLNCVVAGCSGRAHHNLVQHIFKLVSKHYPGHPKDWYKPMESELRS